MPGAAQAALGKRVVQAVLDGMSQAEAARVFGVHPNAVNRWLNRYREGSWDGLGERRRGRRAGEQPALAQAQQQEVVALVRETTPDQLGLPGFLWTREAVGELIAQRYGLWLARTSIGGYLGGWGFQSAEAAAAALEQNPAAVRRWLAEEYPAIWAQAKREAEWCCGWMRWVGSDAAAGGLGRRSARPGHQGDRQAVPGQHDQRHLQRRDAAVPAVCRVVQRPGVPRLSGPTAARLWRAKGPPDRGRPSRAPGQAGQRLGWRHADRIQPHFLPGSSPSRTRWSCSTTMSRPTPRVDAVLGQR